MAAVSEGFSFLLIVVGSGNGDGITVFQSTGLPPLFDTGPVIQPEPPDAAKIFDALLPDLQDYLIKTARDLLDTQSRLLPDLNREN